VSYRINEIFYSIQGEGYWAGRAAVFVRFSDCNLWDGDPASRASAICSFCDTDFVAATEMEDAGAVVNAVEDVMPRMRSWAEPMVIFTGGEPLLQLDADLVEAFRRAGFYTALETNGTLPLKELPVDWVCVSPKTPTVRITHGDELKLVYPQDRVTPERFADLSFAHFWLSPRNAVDSLSADNVQKTLDYLLVHPQWRLNTQVHKVIGVR
jgi:7-carboxy-7-deazaguanine synthase (Cx14CxxC type)